MAKLQNVKVKLKVGHQTIGTWFVTIDPKDPATVRALLAELLDERGIEDPTPYHRVELYKAKNGQWIGQLAAA